MIIFEQIRNATVKLKYNGVTFMIDPWLADACTEEEKASVLAERRFIEKPVCPLPATPKKLVSDVDYFLVTHVHPDHFSADYLPLDKPFIFQNRADMDNGSVMGFVNTSCFSENQPLTLRDITIYRVNARHGNTDELAGRMGATSGFVFVKAGEKTIYLAGDTVYCEGVRQVIDQFLPDVIIVNACDARASSGRLIMNAEDVMKTCECRRGSLVIVSHMDAVSHAHLSRNQLKETLAGSRYEEQVHIPEDGERIEI
jgi:L-ascorbate metabolism protein UlaG (beta-lactamase superfamily)